MGKSNCDIRIGTSGWHYNHWTGLFYPAKLPKSKWFEHYAKNFDTVEINNTFYQLPKQETFKNWHEQASKNFLYTVKANRYITHIKRLKDPSESLERFFERVDVLKENLGPILYQLPPNFHLLFIQPDNTAKRLKEKSTTLERIKNKHWNGILSRQHFCIMARLKCLKLLTAI